MYPHNSNSQELTTMINYNSSIQGLMLFHRYGQPRGFIDREPLYDHIIRILDRFTYDDMPLVLFNNALPTYDN